MVGMSFPGRNLQRREGESNDSSSELFVPPDSEWDAHPRQRLDTQQTRTLSSSSSWSSSSPQNETVEDGNPHHNSGVSSTVSLNHDSSWITTTTGVNPSLVDHRHYHQQHNNNILRHRSPRATAEATTSFGANRDHQVTQHDAQRRPTKVVFSEPPPSSRFPFYTRHEQYQPFGEEDRPAEPSSARQLSAVAEESSDSLKMKAAMPSLRQAARSCVLPRSSGGVDEKKDDDHERLQQSQENDWKISDIHEQLHQSQENDWKISSGSTAENQPDQPSPESLGEDEFDLKSPPSFPLHEICRNATTIQQLVQEAPQYLTVQTASQCDERGQTPLHVLANNQQLLQLLQEPQLSPTKTSTSAEAHSPHQVPFAPSFDSTFSKNSLNSTTSTTTSNHYQQVLHQHEQLLLQFVVGQLVAVYPAAMITCDGSGHIPFEAALSEWVSQVHISNEQHDVSDSTSSSRVEDATSAIGNAALSFLYKSTKSLTPQRKWKSGSNDEKCTTDKSNTPASAGVKDIEGRAGSSRSNGRTPMREERLSRIVSDAGRRNRTFPRNVRLSAHAHFALTVLSAILDQLASIIKANNKKKKILLSRSRSSFLFQHSHTGTTSDETLILSNSKGNRKDSDQRTSFHTALHDLKSLTVHDICNEIVQSIASIPHFLKTILLLQDEDELNHILSLTIVQGVLQSKYAVGPWLTGMLLSGEKRVWTRALAYLKLASDPPSALTRHDFNSFVGADWNPINGENSNSSAKSSGGDPSEKDELYEEVSRLQDFVPSLLALGEKEIEEAATTMLVRRVLDRIISRPFAVTVVICDAIFLTTLLVGYRGAVNRLLLSYSPSKVLVFLYIANTGIFYFIIRELGKAVSLCMITSHTRIYLWSFWNLTDFMSTLLALISSVAIRRKFRSDETDVDDFSSLRGLLAITTGFLWLRVLSFLKGINMQLATFVLAILQISRDVLWFCVILLALILAFAQMMFTLLVPESCTAESDAAECKPSEYYLNVYAILLGDFGTFEREDFDSALSVFLLVVYSFIVVLVLLNVLIAVASDSYEKCLVRSQNLFGRARVMLIAELVSFQNLLRRYGQADETTVPFSRTIYKPWWSSDDWARGWSRGSIVFFSLSSLVVFVWCIAELSGWAAGAQYGNIFLSLGSVFIIVLLFIGIMLFLSTGAADISSRKNVLSEEHGNGRLRHFGAWYEGSVQRVMLRLLGTSNETKTNAFTGDNSWRGRLVFLQREMTRLTEEAKTDSKDRARSTEKALSRAESRLRNDIAGMEKDLTDLRSEIQETLQDVNVRLSRDDELHDKVTQLLLALKQH